jgi:hypothetical protein
MLNLIDLDILYRVICCVYGQRMDFSTIITTREGRLERIIIRDTANNGEIVTRFSIDHRLTVDSHDGTERERIVDCFRQNGIFAN